MADALTSAIASVAADHAAHTRRLIAARLLPFLFILYIVNYMDRTSVAYAALGMSRDLGFSDSVIGLGSGVFFITYTIFQVPGTLLVERWSARRMIFLSMVTWGAFTALTGLVHVPWQLYGARLILGAAEASFFPGVVVYISHWFIQEDRAKAASNFMGAIPVSFVIGSPIAGWILGHTWLGQQGWRWLFFLEGIPAIVLGAVALFFLTDLPGEATWLAPDARQWIVSKLREESSASALKMTVGQALKSRLVLLFAAMTFLNYFMYYGFVFWFPTLLKSDTGFSDVRVGLLGAVPYGAAFIAMQVNGWHSDKNRERRWHAAIPIFMGAVGLLGLLSPFHSLPFLMVCFSLSAAGIAYLPIFWAIPTELLSASAAAAAVGLINAVASVSGFAAPYLFGYLHTRTGSFSSGLALLMVAGAVGGSLILCTPKTRRTTL